MLCFERRGFLAMIAARLMPRPRRGPSTSPVLPDRGTCVRCTAPGCGPTHVPCSQRIGWGRSHILITGASIAVGAVTAAVWRAASEPRCRHRTISS
jgi:hypothetical protein